MITLAAETSKVRLAVREDEEALVEMRRREAVEAGLCMGDGTPFPFCDDMARALIQTATITNRNCPDPPAWIGVVGDPGQLEGGVFLAVRTLDYSPRPYLGMVWHYVWPDYRKSDTAKSLLVFATALSRALSMDLVGATGQQVAKSRMVQRVTGGKPIGNFFVVNSDTAA